MGKGTSPVFVSMPMNVRHSDGPSLACQQLAVLSDHRKQPGSWPGFLHIPGSSSLPGPCMVMKRRPGHGRRAIHPSPPSPTAKRPLRAISLGGGGERTPNSSAPMHSQEGGGGGGGLPGKPAPCRPQADLTSSCGPPWPRL